MDSSSTVAVTVAGGVAAAAMFACARTVGAFHKTDRRTLGRGLGVVITGGTRGFGFAMAKEFVKLNDRVMVCGRDAESVKSAVAKLRAVNPRATVRGMAVDVSDSNSVESLAEHAVKELGSVELWVNNAGRSQSKKSKLRDTPADMIEGVIRTNLLGTIYGCRAALRAVGQPQSGESGDLGGSLHIFNVDGQGSTGGATPNNLAYGASKAAIPQLTKTLARESPANVGVHCISPGMVTTELLMTPDNRQKPSTLKIFNILAEEPETVAAWMVPRLRGIATAPLVPQKSEYIRYLTAPGVAYRFATAASRKNRLFEVTEKAAA